MALALSWVDLKGVGVFRKKKLRTEVDTLAITADKVKLLGVIVESNLKLMNMLILSASRQTEISVPFSIVARKNDPPKCKLLYNSFVLSNVRYSPLIWRFDGKTTD